MKQVSVATPSGVFSAAHANGFFSRFKGLMGKELSPGDALLLSPCGRIHSCFMRSAIDVVYLDGRNRIIKITPGMAPFCFGPRVKGARRVLELTEGTAVQLGLTKNMPLLICDSAS